MIPTYFVFVGIVFNIIGAFSYLVDTLKGRTKPNKVTWFLWALSPLIAFAAEIKHGVGIESLLTFMVGFNPLLIFLASFVNKKSQWKITKLDVACGLLSVVGLALWYFTKNPTVAIFFSILSDGAAGVPTLVKSYFQPETESPLVYLCAAISAGITTLTLTTWDLPHAGFPLYIFGIGTIQYILIKGKLRLVIQKRFSQKKLN